MRWDSRSNSPADAVSGPVPTASDARSHSAGPVARRTGALMAASTISREPTMVNLSPARVTPVESSVFAGSAVAALMYVGVFSAALVFPRPVFGFHDEPLSALYAHFPFPAKRFGSSRCDRRCRESPRAVDQPRNGCLGAIDQAILPSDAVCLFGSLSGRSPHGTPANRNPC